MKKKNTTNTHLDSSVFIFIFSENIAVNLFLLFLEMYYENDGKQCNIHYIINIKRNPIRFMNVNMKKEKKKYYYINNMHTNIQIQSHT